MPNPLDQAFARLDARLESPGPAPLALALSGGGDSVALLLIAGRWAKARGRPLLAFTVDHALQSASGDWAGWCADLCGRLGVPHRTLAWTGRKPATGIPAAARQARHRLLAEAGREAGAAVILFGHTADDAAEAPLMRAEGSTIPDLREWSPSPVWPEGRGLFCLRPLLAVRRERLRDFLRAERQAWIEDPANQDRRHPRVRARQRLSQSLEMAPLAEPARPANPFAAAPGAALFAHHEGGLAPTVLAAALTCAGGGARSPRRDSVARLCERIERGEVFTATLAGARLEAAEAALTIARDAGERHRRGLAPQGLEPGRPLVWDGRFEITAAASGLAVTALAGHAARLSRPERQALRVLPAAVRPSLPVILSGGTVTCPLLAQDAPVGVRALVFERFAAATGMICREAALRRVAESADNP